MMQFLTYLFLLLHLFKSPFHALDCLSSQPPFPSFLSSDLLLLSLSLSPMCPSTFLYQIKHLWTLASTQQPALYKAWPSPEVCPSALPSDLLTNQNFHFLDINILFFSHHTSALVLILHLHSVPSPPLFPAFHNITTLFVCV